MREFWIDICGRELDSGNAHEAEIHFNRPSPICAEDPEDGKNYNIHVIEYSAYEKLRHALECIADHNSGDEILMRIRAADALGRTNQTAGKKEE